jgi:hypothetical protein
MKMKIDYDQFEAKESDILNKARGRAEIFVQKHKVPVASGSSLFGLFIMGIMLCISSITLPASWFALVGYIKGFGVIERSIWGGLIFSAGAFAGTTIWFWLLLKLITGNKHKIDKSTISRLNFIAGIVLIVLGVFLFGKATGTVFNIF